MPHLPVQHATRKRENYQSIYDQRAFSNSLQDIETLALLDRYPIFLKYFFLTFQAGEIMEIKHQQIEVIIITIRFLLSLVS